MPYNKDQLEELLEKGEDLPEFLTQEEIDERRQAIIEEEQTKWREEHLTPLEKELAEERKFRAEQAQNFKRLKDMTEEEKAKLTEEQIQAQKMAETALERAEKVESELKSRDEKESSTRKEQAIQSIVGDNKEMREKLEAQLDIINPEKLPDAKDQVVAAAKMLGIYKEPGERNPINQSYDGAPPQGAINHGSEEDKQKFFEQGKGKAAMDIINNL